MLECERRRSSRSSITDIPSNAAYDILIQVYTDKYREQQPD